MIDLSFEGVSKRYLVRREADEDATLHPWVRKLKALRRPREEFWALRDVSFAVERGETLGIIGHNGAGKSTMLKLLASITSPTTGRIAINGRLSALIEVGSGFHPELTGRENIFLNGAILGMRRKEIAAKLDSIVDFAGVRPFLDVPVKRFSSGMYVRLGFSIAAHLDPDILLLDEVLAVGDAAFQDKCLTRIEELKRAGTTIVFISHDLSAVQRICDRVLLMRRGVLAASGTGRAMIAEYQSHFDASSLNIERTALQNDDISIRSLAFVSADGVKPLSFRTGDTVIANIEFEAHETVRDAVIDVQFVAADASLACQLSTETSERALELKSGGGILRFTCRELGLKPGIYHANVAVKTRGAPEALKWQYQAATLRVDPGKLTAGEFYQPNEWELAPLPKRDASLRFNSLPDRSPVGSHP